MSRVDVIKVATNLIQEVANHLPRSYMELTIQSDVTIEFEHDVPLPFIKDCLAGQNFTDYRVVMNHHNISIILLVEEEN